LHTFPSLIAKKMQRLKQSNVSPLHLSQNYPLSKDGTFGNVVKNFCMISYTIAHMDYEHISITY